jgi:hypothetical protein
MNNEQEIVSRLKFIGKMKKGEKINTHHMYVQPEGLMTTIKRTFWINDNRFNALTFIKETISRVFELLLTLQRSEKDGDNILASNLIYDIRAAKVGLSNIKATYIDDTKFCCDIDTILEYINARLFKFSEHILPEYIPTDEL